MLVARLGVAAWLVHHAALAPRPGRRCRSSRCSTSASTAKGCICAIGAPQNVAYGLFDAGLHHPADGARRSSSLPLVFSLFTGRTFCAAVCPHGALQDLVLIKPVKVPAWLEHGLGTLPFLFLGAGLLFAATGAGFIICRYDPFVPLFRMTGSLFILTPGRAVPRGLDVRRPAVLPLSVPVRRAAETRFARLEMARAHHARLLHAMPAVRTFLSLRRDPRTDAAPANPDRPRAGPAPARLAASLAVPVLIAGGAWIGSQLASRPPGCIPPSRWPSASSPRGLRPPTRRHRTHPGKPRPRSDRSRTRPRSSPTPRPSGGRFAPAAGGSAAGWGW